MIAVAAGHARTCERHGGPWGSDATCPRCTTEDGFPRDPAKPGPLGAGGSPLTGQTNRTSTVTPH